LLIAGFYWFGKPQSDYRHIADQSGHGPWPDGVLRFGRFLAGLEG